MEKLQLKDLQHIPSMIIHQGETSIIMLLEDGTYFKWFKPSYINKSKKVYSNIEKRLQELDKIKDKDNLVLPTNLVYDKKTFCGYTMEEVPGRSIDELHNRFMNLDICNIENTTQRIINIQDLVLSKKDIVFPDLCSNDNIYTNTNTNSVYLPDCDGFQINNMSSGVVSNMINYDKYRWYNTRYMKEDSEYIYTKELDIKSIYFLYFYYMFNIDLGLTNKEGDNISLETIFNTINLNDNELYNNIINLFNYKKGDPNKPLNIETLKYIMNNYKLESEYNKIGNCIYEGPYTKPKGIVRKLVRK